ncbi:MAG: gliding motility protein GldM [Roseivirga sp.]|nr:gliding motility protein GldM [Roseivirga sp.]
MAGGKETPRQRMIGMMYLVLTALLALQIKDTVLEKFALMEEGLGSSNSSYMAENNNTVSNITSEVANQGDKPEDVAVLESAKNVRALTTDVITFIDGMKEELELGATGGDLTKRKERSVLKKYEEPSHYMVEKGNANILKEKLDQYNADMLGILQENAISRDWRTLALNANEMDLYKDNPEERKKGFADLNFYKTPLASTIAQLTFYQNQIYARESDALGELAAKVGATTFKGFDVISGTVLPVSNIVTAGTNFEAQLFLTAANSALAPEMTKDGQSLTVDDEGRGKVEFKASARDADYDANGLAKKTFKAEIKYNNNGVEEVIPITHEYFVAKPTIQIGLNAVSALYLNCANNLKIDVPSLGPAYQPSFQVTGGKAVPGANKGDVMIAPNQRNIKIGVSSAGIFIDNVDFTARRAPLPTFKLQVNGKDYNASQGLNSAPASVTLFLSADAEFKAAYPDDARFFVTKGKIELARGSNAIKVIQIKDRTFSVNLAEIRSQARKGDRIVVEVEEVTRYNFENVPETFTFGEKKVMSIN